MTGDYEAACKRATTNQGLDPVIEALRTDGLDAFAEQTGGFTMVAAVYGDDSRVWIIDDGDKAKDGTHLYNAGVYYFDCVVCAERMSDYGHGDCEGHSLEMDGEMYSLLSLIDLPAATRRALNTAVNPYDCTVHDPRKEQ